jgi:hypothetical protein
MTLYAEGIARRCQRARLAESTSLDTNGNVRGVGN